MYNIKKQDVEIDSSASSEGQGKHMKHVSFDWPLLETALSTINISFLKNLKRNF
jgi:hypothetical protein